jgi:alpha-beta hydrolase superfamily lysophospholipase
MIEARTAVRPASDGYPTHVLIWPAEGSVRGRVVVLHGVQSHGGWYHGFGSRLAVYGFEAHFPDRRGSGANTRDRGHAPSARRLVEDVAELLRSLRDADPESPLVLAGISWGGKTAILTAAKHPELVDGLALICPGLQPRVGVSLGERLRIALAVVTNPRKRFPIPLSDPALFTANPVAQAFIASDPLGLRQATAALLAASTVIDLRVKRAAAKVREPALLMLAGQDRIVDNARTLAYFRSLASPDKQVIEYPEAHHTLEFEPEPFPARYAGDFCEWLDRHVISSPSGARRASGP